METIQLLKKIAPNNAPILNEKEVILKKYFCDNIDIQIINYLTKITYISDTFPYGKKNYSINIFCAFESINNIFYLIFAHYSSIMVYNINDNKKVN